MVRAYRNSLNGLREASLDLQLLKSELLLDEGKRNFPYTDTVGKLTIGVGRNITDRGISDAEIDFLLDNDIQECFRALNERLPWWKLLDGVRQRVLVNMCFNLGINRLCAFHETLSCLQTGHWNLAAQNMLNSKWAGQVGVRAVRLANMVKTGEAK